ncbi:TadE-like protein [Acidovorax sp. 62]|nr:TadE-like protein [Acidovorax sp. 62]
MKRIGSRGRLRCKQSRGVRGVSMTETLIALPVVLVLSLSVIQFALIYRASLTVQYAAHEAARGGSLNNALPVPYELRIPSSRKGMLPDAVLGNVKSALTKGSVWQGLVRGMMPLYVKDASVGGVFKGWADTHVDLLKAGCVEYLNPTQNTFLDWAMVENYGEHRGIVRIPNDTLRYRKPLPYERDAKTSAVDTAAGNLNDPGNPRLRGAASNKTLGESNILHLRVHYGYKLNVPIAGPIIIKAMQGYAYVSHSFQSVMTTSGGVKPDGASTRSAIDEHFLSQGRFPLTKEGVAGMQSSLYWHPFYAFGPQRDASDINASFNWSVAGSGSGLEQYATIVPDLVGIIRGGAQWVTAQAGNAALGGLKDAVGLRNAFCPAIWSDPQGVENVPNPFSAAN